MGLHQDATSRIIDVSYSFSRASAVMRLYLEWRGVLDSLRKALFNLRSRLLLSTRSRAFAANRFSEHTLIRSSLCTPQGIGTNVCLNKFMWQSFFRYFERRSATVIREGRHVESCFDVEGRRQSVTWPLAFVECLQRKKALLPSAV